MKRSILLLAFGVSLVATSKEKIVNMTKSGGGLFGYDYVSQNTSILNAGTSAEIWIVDMNCSDPGKIRCKYNATGNEVSDISLTNFEERILDKFVALSDVYISRGVTSGTHSEKYLDYNDNRTLKSFTVSWNKMDSVTKISVRISDYKSRWWFR